MKHRGWGRLRLAHSLPFVLLLLLALALSGCSTLQASGAGASASPSAGTPQPVFTAKLAFTPPQAKIGDTVAFSGTGYPANSKVDLDWHSVIGSYDVKDGSEFVGQRFSETSKVLLSVQSDAAGAISGNLTVPQDYGGEHDVRGSVNGKEISQASVTVGPTFSLTPSSGPVGTMIELKITGVDWQTNVNTWHVLYNNHYLGFVSGVTTGGVAIARFRAAGPVGVAQVSVWHNSYNPIPYLNFQQGPYKNVPTAGFTFNVTSDPQSASAQVEDYSASDMPAPVSATGPGKLALSVDRGPVGTNTTLQGSALPANTSVTLRWWTMVGNRVSSTGFSDQSKDLGTVQTDANGSFTKTIAIPDDLGGQHRLEVVQGDKILAATGLVIEPSIVSITPTQATDGQDITIHLKGLGWTTIDNTYAVTYDDSYIGYVCGFSTNGDVQFTVKATGGAGTHIIDLYPTIYKGQDARPSVYSVPQLSYATDHPQRTTPAIRMSIVITK